MKKFLGALIFMSITTQTIACWKVTGSLGVDGETFKIDQKIEHNKDYSLPMGPYILGMQILKNKSTHVLKYSLHEKRGIKLTLVTQGEEEISPKKEIYAKGEPGQPHSIITLNIKDI